MQKFMWIVLIVALLALALSVFSLYRITRLTNGKSLLPDISALISQTDPSTKNPDDTVASEYQRVSIEELWENRGDLSGKKIELRAELDTDTMVLQPTPFPNPIQLTKPDLIDSNKDTWIRNEGKQDVVLQGTFYLGKTLLGTVGTTTLETYTIVVDRMMLERDAASAFFFWPDKKTPTLEINVETLSILEPEVLRELDGKPVTYVGQYVSQPSPSTEGLLDGLVVMHVGSIQNPEILTHISGTKTHVKVWGVFHLKRNLHGESYELDASRIEIKVDSSNVITSITKDRALHIARQEAGKEANAEKLLTLETHISLEGETWRVSFLAPNGKGDTVGGGLPTYVIDVKTGQVLSKLLQR